MASKSWFSGSGRGSSWFNFSDSSGSDSNLTLNQALSLIEAQKRSKKKSLLGDIWGGSKKGLGFALRQIMRPSHGMAEGVRRALEGEGVEPGDFFKGFSRGFQLKKRTTFSDVLEQEGVLKGHRRLRGLAGFGLDVITDPTLPLWVGATVATGGAAAPVLLAAKTAQQTTARVGVKLVEKKAAYEALEKAAKEAGESFSGHQLMAKVERKQLTKLESGKHLDETDEAMAVFAREMAEQDLVNIDKVFQLKIGLPKLGTKALTPTSVAGVRVAPKLPSLRRTALGGGILGKAAPTRGAAMALGRTFRHGFLEEEWQKPLLAQAHLAEKLFDRYTNVAIETFSPYRKKLSKDQQFQALAWGEKRTDLVQGPERALNERVLNEAVEANRLSDVQADFIRDWHKYWETMRSQDKKFGVKYKKELGDKLYVPHVYRADGGIVSSSDVAQAGFTQKRTAENLTIGDMYEAQKNGVAKSMGWITDPLELAAVRTRRAAQAHTREALLSTMRFAGGKPATVPNLEKYNKIHDELQKSLKEFAKWERFYKPQNRLSFLGNRSKKFYAQHRKEVAAIRKKYGTLRATARTNEEAAKHVRTQARLLENADKRLERNIAYVKDDLHKWTERAHKEAVRLHTKIEKLERAYDHKWVKRNPSIPEDFVKLDRAIQGEKYYFKPELHDMMTRVEHAMRNDAELEKIVSTYHKYMAKWKIAVTSVNPGYRVRNSISDVWNMYIAGVPAHAMVRYAGRAENIRRHAERAERKIAAATAANTSVKLTKQEQRALHTIWEAHGHGVLSGLFQGDIGTVGKAVMAGSASRAYLQSGRPLAAFARAAQSFNRRWEDRGRLVHYLYRREGQKLSAEEAARHVKRAHFDYTELTPVEREKFRAFMPFYTWTRKNLPYQLVQLVSRPGKYATFPKMLQESNYAATGDAQTPMLQEGTLPEWLRQRYAFRIPFFGNESVALPVMGVSDLAKLEHPKEFLNMLAPQWRAAYELGTGKSMLTGQKIFEGRRRPISGVGAAIAGVLPGANIGPTERVVRGERVSGVGAAPWVGYLAGQLPMSNFVVNQLASISRKRRGSLQTGIGYGLGLPTYQRDLEAELVSAQIEHSETMANIIRQLRDENIIPEREGKQKESAFQKRLNKLLGGAGG